MLLRQYKNTIYLKNNRRYSYFFLFFNDSLCLPSRSFVVSTLWSYIVPAVELGVSPFGTPSFSGWNYIKPPCLNHARRSGIFCYNAKNIYLEGAGCASALFGHLVHLLHLLHSPSAFFLQQSVTMVAS